MKIYTIGGYGFNERTFINALTKHHIDTFVDVRQRRGMRGRQYAFLNSSRLRALLAGQGIRYVHASNLAPTTSIRDLQRASDSQNKIQKRERTVLSPEFIAAYTAGVLGHTSPSDFIQTIGTQSGAIAIFCVETEPTACHRSLVAQFISGATGEAIEHIRP